MFSCRSNLRVEVSTDNDYELLLVGIVADLCHGVVHCLYMFVGVFGMWEIYSHNAKSELVPAYIDVSDALAHRGELDNVFAPTLVYSYGNTALVFVISRSEKYMLVFCGPVFVF